MRLRKRGILILLLLVVWSVLIICIFEKNGFLSKHTWHVREKVFLLKTKQPLHLHFPQHYIGLSTSTSSELTVPTKFYLNDAVTNSPNNKAIFPVYNDARNLTMKDFSPQKNVDEFKTRANFNLSTESYENITFCLPKTLNWIRQPNDTDISMLLNGTNLIKKGSSSNFACDLKNISIENDDKKIHILPLSYRQFLTWPIPQPQCGKSHLLKPWLYENNQVVDMLFLIKTAPKHIRRRITVRETYASIQSLRGMRFATIFLLGTTNNHEMQELLLEENRLFGDMLQCNFTDEYKALPVKVLSSFRWLLEDHVTSTHYTVIDDDCVINLLKMNTYFQETGSDNSMFCGFMYHEGGKPHRNPESKWYISPQLYSSSDFPTFCRGGMWTISKAMMHHLYCMSEVTERRSFHLEDVYITGILRRKLENQDENIKPVVDQNGKEIEVMYYPWDESNNVHVNMAVQWNQWNHTLPWGSKATVAGLPIMTIFPKQNGFHTNSLLKKWIHLEQKQVAHAEKM